MLNNIANFSLTLQKIHSFVEDQLNMGKLKRFFRQADNAHHLEDCKAGLQHALEAFAIQSSLSASAKLAEMQISEDSRQEELLALIAARATTTSSSDFSSISGGFSSLGNSSSSLSLLPAVPKIFYGRESELRDTVAILLQESPRIAILGSGGMGKTSLAAMALHHPDISAKFPSRHFVTCDSATTFPDLLAIIASHLELQTSPKLQKIIIQHFSSGPPVLLVLDNFETVWEPLVSRSETEEFLSRLTDIPHLALMITMRGAEHPRKVRWTRPFLPPLQPLADTAARLTFYDIADDSHDHANVDELLKLTDNLPLAVNLIANLVSYEGTENTLLRWKDESTSLLSEGYDKRSNLDISIMLSLSSPRMLSFPAARDLLGIISLLPDGLSEVDLLQSALPIHQIDKCRAVLIRTTLVYVDRNGRLKALVPIREYVRNVHPPPLSLVRPMLQHLSDLLMLWKTHQSISSPESVSRVLENLGNIHSLLSWGLIHDSEEAARAIQIILALDSFTRAAGRWVGDLMSKVPDLLQRCEDPQLQGQYISVLLEGHEYQAISAVEDLEIRGIRAFKAANDPVGEVQLLNVLGTWYLIHIHDRDAALAYFNRALSLSLDIRDPIGQGRALTHLAEIEWTKGNYRAAQKYSQQAQHGARSIGNLMLEANAMKVEIISCTSIGDFKRGVELCNKTREILTLCGMRGGALDIGLMNPEGDIHFFKTEYAQSRYFHTQLLDKIPKEQSPNEYAFALINLAFVDSAIGADGQAVRASVDAARSIFAQLSPTHVGHTFCDIIIADVQVYQGLKAEPRLFYERCLASNTQRAEIAILCLEKLGDMAYALCDVHSTFRYVLVLLAAAKKSESLVSVHQALRFLGDIFIAQGDEDTAVNLYTAALDGFTAMDVHRGKGDCMIRLGDISKGHGNTVKAAALWKEARTMFELSSHGRQVERVEERLNLASPRQTLQPLKLVPLS
ncbi:hypothetical protein C8J57DRAFT_1198315 [Mycena rebaudengoi]|nr:hypothetical protein C8J57DRAFT_1198315 [Mycena rebaudengoi]